MAATAVALGAFSGAGPPASGSIAEPPSQRWAFLVGRADGTDDPVPELRRLGALLRDRYGYGASNLTEIYGAEASAERLRSSLSNMLERLRPADTLFAYLALPGIKVGADLFLVTEGSQRDEPWTMFPLFEIERLSTAQRARATFMVLPRCEGDGAADDRIFGKMLYSRGQDQALALLSHCPGDGAPNAASGRNGLTAMALALREALDAPPADRLDPDDIGLHAAGQGLRVRMRHFPEKGAQGFSFIAQRSRLATLRSALAMAPSDADSVKAIERLVAAALAEPVETRGPLVDEAGTALLAAVEKGGAIGYRATIALGEIRYEKAVPQLGALLVTAPDASARKAALDALQRIGGDPAIGFLRSALRDSSPLVRAAAVSALGLRGDAPSLPVFIELVRDPDATVRIAALQAFGEFSVRKDEMRAAAMAALADDSATVRREAAVVIGSLDPAPVSDLMLRMLRSDPDPGVSQAVAYSLGRSFVESDRMKVEQALLHASEDKARPQVREAAVWALGSIGGSGIAERRLREGLRDVDARVRRTSAERLGELELPRAVPDLIRLLADRETEVRLAAIDALGKIADPRALDPLLRLLDDPNVYVRQQAKVALEQIKAAPAAGLREKLHDASPRVRTEAARRVGEIGNLAAVPFLIAALGDDVGDVRREAIGALSKFMDDASLAKMRAGFQSNDFRIRQGIVVALGRGGSPKAAGLILGWAGDPSGAVRSEVIRALGRLDPGAAAPALGAVKDPDPEVRLAAAEVLGKAPKGEAIRALRTLSGDASEPVRQTALIALGKFTKSP